ncbi:MAG: hypothetical protein NXI04_02070 [Planctomycetaceae bacterium]|nr:hypothetical protein [Planctomycetaceae bacterium]
MCERRRFRSTSRLTQRAVAATLLTLLAVSPVADAQQNRRYEVGGYDLTELIVGRRLIKGMSRFSVRYDRRTYYFASRESKQQFLKDPARYVPVLGGDCIVCYADSGDRVAGSNQYALIHNRRLYLFPSERTKQRFAANPSLYEHVDLAADGRSVVWLVNHRRDVKGQRQWTAVVDGLRYQFTSQAERREFLRNRVRYVQLAMNPRQIPARGAATGRGPIQPLPSGSAPSLASQFTSLQIARGAAPSQLFQLGALRNGLTADLQALRNLEQAGNNRQTGR